MDEWCDRTACKRMEPRAGAEPAILCTEVEPRTIPRLGRFSQGLASVALRTWESRDKPSRFSRVCPNAPLWNTIATQSDQAQPEPIERGTLVSGCWRAARQGSSIGRTLAGSYEPYLGAARCSASFHTRDKERAGG